MKAFLDSPNPPTSLALSPERAICGRGHVTGAARRSADCRVSTLPSPGSPVFSAAQPVTLTAVTVQSRWQLAAFHIFDMKVVCGVEMQWRGDTGSYSCPFKGLSMGANATATAAAPSSLNRNQSPISLN